jgi:hypothetical protein
MLIIALVLAVVGLAALVTAVVTSNELIAWVCIAASVIGVLLLIVDALRERSRGGRTSGERTDPDTEDAGFDEEYPADDATAAVATDRDADTRRDTDTDIDADTTAVPVDSREDEGAGEDRNRNTR